VPILYGFLAILAGVDKALASGNGLEYFLGIINCSEALVATGRDISATWGTLGTLCRERDWSRRALIDKWRNRQVTIRTIPRGCENKIDLHDPSVVDSLDIEASEISYFDEEVAEQERFSSRYVIVASDGKVTVGIEALLSPLEAEAAADVDETPAPSADASAASPAPPRKVSEAELRQCILSIAEAHPPGTPPLSDKSLHKKAEGRLGVTLARDRVLLARDEVAPHFKLPVGRPRKNAQ
jgi:hypothetical protein